MSISARLMNNEKELVIQINGRFDFSLHADFQQAYREHAIQGGRYILDLSQTEYLDSSALGMMLLLKEFADAISAHVSVRNANNEIREILQIASFDRLFNMS